MRVGPGATRRRATTHRAQVHLPRVIVESDPARRSDRLALVDERAQDVTQVAELVLLGEGVDVGKIGQSGDAIHRGVEDELRPLRGDEIGKRLGAQP
jgi:hypothetical protein